MPDSIYGVLHRECFNLFPDEMFADLFTDVGRRSVPPMIVAVVMVLQRIEGLSDREAVERFAFDARWKYAAGGLDFDYPGFVHTVLVDMRARLARSDRPDRIFEVTLEAAKAAGLVGRRRVLDSTPLYDAVATMDTVTLIRSAIRGLLKVADAELAGRAAGRAAPRRRLRGGGQTGVRLRRCGGAGGAGGCAGPRRDGAAGGAGRARAGPEVDAGRAAAGHRGRPGPRPRHRRGVPHRPPGRHRIG